LTRFENPHKKLESFRKKLSAEKSYEYAIKKKTSKQKNTRINALTRKNIVKKVFPREGAGVVFSCKFNCREWGRLAERKTKLIPHFKWDWLGIFLLLADALLTLIKAEAILKDNIKGEMPPTTQLKSRKWE